ncbi:MAG TPA: DUF5668 domain-containing protein [Candidatus Dormibacteraeota bacterium]|nr:DUF5668 domain-containing protein [Candidatus Dormibacteraeota bacterium]
MENPSQPPVQTSLPSAPPPPPAHGGAWFGVWGWFWAIALILVGVYYLLVNLGLMSWVRGDLVWPVLLIVLGGLFLISRLRPGRA